MLGSGNVFLMFIAVAYVALECKTLLMSSATQLSKGSGCFRAVRRSLKRGLNGCFEVKASKGICANGEEEMACSSADED